MRARSIPDPHPLAAVALGLLGAGLWAAWAALRFPPEKAAFNYLYVVPIVFPFVTFLLERTAGPRRGNRRNLALDAAVTLVAIWRVVGHVPIVSGHALFLTYAAATSRTRVTVVASLLVLAETMWLKLFVWHEYASVSSGIVLGALCALAHWRTSGRYASVLAARSGEDS